MNGREYAGWKSARISRGIESISGAFDLDVSDRWGTQREPWPILEEDECELLLEGTSVIKGYVDRRSLAYGASDHRLGVSGRDRTAALVDCSAVLTTWEFRGVPLLTLARKLAEPFGVPVNVQPGLSLPPPAEKVTIDPGDTAFEALERACRMVGVLPITDGAGGVLLSRPGSARATTELVEGKNIKEASAEGDATGRFRRYVVKAQQQGSDGLHTEAAARVHAESSDAGVRRAERVLLIRPEGNATTAYARKRAEWECAVRAARGSRVAVTVQGWRQGDGSLWPVNALVRIRSPLLGLDDDMLITEATYSLDGNGGTTTELALKRADAYRPEPQLPASGDPLTSRFAPAPVQVPEAANASIQPDNMSVWERGGLP